MIALHCIALVRQCNTPEMCNYEIVNVQAFIQAWKAACNSASPAKVVIPAGTFMTSPAIFQGPCKSKPVIMEVIGTVEASTDLSAYPSKEWILFEQIDGLVLKGKGTFDGKGESAWKYNDCKSSNYKNCQGLPSVSITLHRTSISFKSIIYLNLIETISIISFHDAEY